MKELLFATNNLHKLTELRQILHNDYTILGLDDIKCTAELPETQDTLQGNALQKAQYVYESYGLSCFADDTGLEIDALNGAPGVYSARFTGEKVSFKQNRDKVLHLLNGVENRKARFRTVIALILNGHNYFFEGTAEGAITCEEHGTAGFGYDCIFMPDNHQQTFAEMSAALKNTISHRGIAVRKFADFLLQNKL